MARELTEAARCAKEIRKELKQNFPGIKFKVVSDNFAGGDSVNVSWIDGPTSDRVDLITKKYQYGHFDGMQDMYEYSNSRDDIPQAKYVQTNREMSDETRAKIIAEHNAEWCQEAQIRNESDYNEHMRQWNYSVVWRKFQETDLET